MDLREAKMEVRELKLTLKSLKLDQKEKCVNAPKATSQEPFLTKLDNLSVLEFVLHHRAFQNKIKDPSKRQLYVLKYKKLFEEMKTGYAAYLYFRLVGLGIGSARDERLDKDPAVAIRAHPKDPWLNGLYGGILVDGNEKLGRAAQALKVCLKEGSSFPTYDYCKKQHGLAVAYQDAVARTKKPKWLLSKMEKTTDFKHERKKSQIVYTQYTTNIYSGQDSKFQAEVKKQTPNFRLLNLENERYRGKVFALSGYGELVEFVQMMDGTQKSVFGGKYSKRTHYAVRFSDGDNLMFVFFPRARFASLFKELKGKKNTVPMRIRARMVGGSGASTLDGLKWTKVKETELRRLYSQFRLKYTIKPNLVKLNNGGYAVGLDIEHLSLKEAEVNAAFRIRLINKQGESTMNEYLRFSSGQQKKSIKLSMSELANAKHFVIEP